MVFSFNQAHEFLSELSNYGVIKSKNKEYLNIAISFDIETTSFYRDMNGRAYKTDIAGTHEKVATMFIWQLAISDNVIIGRTWPEFKQLLEMLVTHFNVGGARYIIIYVHNLTYEFQFMRKWFIWDRVFAISERTPIECVTIDNIIFRCSYALSGYSLEMLAKNLQSHTIEKLIGYLDYRKLRHSKTQLTDKEISYCVYDVLIVTAYIEEQIRFYGNITNLPLTKTSAIRRVTRKKCFSYKNYHRFIGGLTFSKNEYLIVRNAFSGGFVHSNSWFTNVTVTDVTSFDINSSYPSVMIYGTFPMSKGVFIEIENEKEIFSLWHKYALVMEIVINELRPRVEFENILSISKCISISKDCVINNGRVVSAGLVRLCVTDIDFYYLKKFYTWRGVKILQCVKYIKKPLPRAIIETVLELYRDKTTLKNVKGREVEYMHAKELLNSVYGMCVTKIVRDEFVYENNDWCVKEADIEKELSNYNTDKNRFLFYLWGVYITAYARANLFDAILECANDYVYSDTDSVKFFNYEAHKSYFENKNNIIKEAVKNALINEGLSVDYASPVTINNEKKFIGLWEYEATYSRFKTLGAKRYIYEKDNDIFITIAGVGKMLGKEFLKKQDAFNYFNDLMIIPSKYSGRLIHTYIDDIKTGVLIDEAGVESEYKELSSIHLSESEYNLNLSEEYIRFLTHNTRRQK